MPIVLSLLLLQAATAPATPPASPAADSGKIDILTRPCANASNDGGDVVVCGRSEDLAPRLPLARYRGVPDHAVPSNPDMSAAVALNGPGVGTECGAYGEGCPIGGGGYAIPALLNGASGLVKKAFAKHPDKAGRVAIPMTDDPPVDSAGRCCRELCPGTIDVRTNILPRQGEVAREA